MARKFVVFLIQIFFKLTCRVKMNGIENLLSNDRVIAAANHLGTLDAPLILSQPEIAQHSNLIVPVAKKHSKYAIYRFAVKHLDFLWLDRFNVDLKTLKEVFKRLNKPESLMVIAPEGTRSPTGALIEAKPGVIYIAAKSGAKIVPAAIINSEDKAVIQSFKKLKRHSITIQIGKPISIPSLPRQNKDAFLKKYTDETMCQIAALLPEQYRGFYANHPRLKEILANQ